MKKVNELAGTKESDTGLAVPALWDLAADKQALQTEEPLQVRRNLLPYSIYCKSSNYSAKKKKFRTALGAPVRMLKNYLRRQFLYLWAL